MRVLAHLALVMTLLVSTPMAALCSVRCITAPAEAVGSVHCHKTGETDSRTTPTTASHEAGGCLCALEAPRNGARVADLSIMAIGMTAVVDHPTVHLTSAPAQVAPSALSPPLGSTPFADRNPPLRL